MSDIIVPSSPADLQAINQVMKEISNSKARAESEVEYQKDALKELEDRFGIKVKHLRRMANDFHKRQFDEKVAELDDYQQLYESVFKTNFNPSIDDDDEN